MVALHAQWPLPMEEIYRLRECGVVKIPLATEKTMVVHDVRHAPELALNLLSLYRRDHWTMAVQDVPDLRHCRLGHLSRRSMKPLQDGQATGIPSDAITKTDYATCLKGKQCRLPFSKLATKGSEDVLELVHSGICGPMQVVSVGGTRYFLSFIDDFSRKSFVYFLKHKNEALPKFKDFIAMVERQTSNGFKKEFLARKGIRHERTIPETRQQNGVAERMNRTLVEKARTMLIDANLSPDLCAKAVGTANYLRNRCPTKTLRKMTPEEAWSGRKPNLAHLKVFGCLAMVYVPSGQRKKWDLKSKERIFVGCCETSKGYRTASKEESTNPLPNPEVGEEPVIVWTPRDGGLTDPPKVDTDSDEPISQVREQSDPISYEEAVNHPDAKEWLKAINEELASHRENQSWEPAILPPHKKPSKINGSSKRSIKKMGRLRDEKRDLWPKDTHNCKELTMKTQSCKTLKMAHCRLTRSSTSRKCCTDSECPTAEAPLDPNQVLSNAMMLRSDGETKRMHTVPYREAVGCLVYLSQSCEPDICQAVGIVCRFLITLERHIRLPLSASSDT
ncbi:integrase core domain protein [Trichinella nativa]|uniref:Integrase core domain protein n=1 Tax=Trichinella nativa TaxID=6335 RepID=A0A1Y3ELP7_9BILA|nr:integrase core domain protein [Trichinella nativa]